MKHRQRAALAAMMIAASTGSSFAANETRVFENVTAAVFQCVKETSEARQGTLYTPTGDNIGTATTSSTLWIVVMDYAFTPESQTLRYSLVRKSWIVPADAVWGGISDMIAECGGGT